MKKIMIINIIFLLFNIKEIYSQDDNNNYRNPNLSNLNEIQDILNEIESTYKLSRFWDISFKEIQFKRWAISLYEYYYSRHSINDNEKHEEDKNCAFFSYSMARELLDQCDNFLKLIINTQYSFKHSNITNQVLNFINFNQLKSFNNFINSQVYSNLSSFFQTRSNFIQNELFSHNEPSIYFVQKCIFQWSQAALNILTYGYSVKMMAISIFNPYDFIESIETEAVSFLNYVTHSVKCFINTLNKLQNGKTLPPFTPNNSYIELKGFIKKILVNNIDGSAAGDVCKNNCILTSNYTLPCNGKTYNCQSYGFQFSEICLTEDGKNYDYLLTHEGKCYGNDQVVNSYIEVCRNKAIYNSLISNNSESIDLCDFCMCTCRQDDLATTYYFDARQVETNYFENMVVTGVRFQVKNNVIYIQIQQGKLGKEGEILSNPQWKKIKYLKPLEIHSKTYKIGHHIDKIHLDDILVPLGHVITGLKINSIDGVLDLNVLSTLYDVNNGQLNEIGPHIWINRCLIRKIDPCVSSKNQLKLNDSNRPILSNTNHLNSQSNQFVMFETTHFETSDLGKSTIPFLDSRSTFSTPGFPLSGIGLYHQGAPGFGGFISFKLYPFDYRPQKIPSQFS